MYFFQLFTRSILSKTSRFTDKVLYARIGRDAVVALTTVTADQIKYSLEWRIHISLGLAYSDTQWYKQSTNYSKHIIWL